MIILFEGFPGSGKTYDATRKVLANLGKGRRVLTNIDGLNQEQQRVTIQHFLDIDDLDGQLVYLTDEDVLHFWDFTKQGDIVVIDEAQDYFNSRDWQKNSNRQFSKWASSHRHNGHDLFLITPNQSRIESSVRDMIEWYYRYKKLNMFGSMIQKGYIRFAFYGSDLEPIGRKVCRYDDSVFKCYKSFFESDIKEHATMKHANILKHPIILSVPLVLLALFYFGSKSTFFSGDLFGSAKFQKKVSNNLTSKSDLLSKKQELKSSGVIGHINGVPILKKGNRIVFGS